MFNFVNSFLKKAVAAENLEIRKNETFEKEIVFENEGVFGKVVLREGQTAITFCFKEHILEIAITQNKIEAKLNDLDQGIDDCLLLLLFFYNKILNRFLKGNLVYRPPY